jgi:metal-dependent amidase/aminoacylase/carboxypeptidase family protein
MTLKERATSAFTAVEAELQALSRWMFENPELGHQEVESSARLAALLSDHGFDVTHPARGLDTAFEATVGANGPRVVICAEYDALPGVGHACGHNIIATSSAGAGIALAGLASELGIRITVLGTPAEEGGGGKIDLIEAGAFLMPEYGSRITHYDRWHVVNYVRQLQTQAGNTPAGEEQ